MPNFITVRCIIMKISTKMWLTLKHDTVNTRFWPGVESRLRNTSESRLGISTLHLASGEPTWAHLGVLQSILGVGTWSLYLEYSLYLDYVESRLVLLCGSSELEWSLDLESRNLHFGESALWCQDLESRLDVWSLYMDSGHWIWGMDLESRLRIQSVKFESRCGSKNPDLEVWSPEFWVRSLD